MKKIILITVVVALFSLNALAQKAKTVNITFKSGDNAGEFLGDAKSIGTTIFLVKLKAGQCFEAAAKIESNNSKMSGEYYTKNADGTIDETSISAGEGTFSNQFSGCTNEADTFYFKIKENPKSKFSFSILVKNGRIN